MHQNKLWLLWLFTTNKKTANLKVESCVKVVLEASFPTACHSLGCQWQTLDFLLTSRQRLVALIHSCLYSFSSDHLLLAMRRFGGRFWFSWQEKPNGKFSNLHYSLSTCEKPCSFKHIERVFECSEKSIHTTCVILLHSYSYSYSGFNQIKVIMTVYIPFWKKC